jgi:hypothetical protein
MCLAATGALQACGSSDSDNGGSNSSTFSSGLPKDESLGSLSDADSQTLCNALASYSASAAAAQKDSGCKIVGFGAAGLAHNFGSAKTDADVQKACSDAETACKNSPPQRVDAGAPTCTKPPASCTATVGELETCLTDSSAALSDALSKIPECTSLTVADVTPKDGGLVGPTGSVPSCSVVNQKCPGLLSAAPPGP